MCSNLVIWHTSQGSVVVFIHRLDGLSNIGLILSTTGSITTVLTVNIVYITNPELSIPVSIISRKHHAVIPILVIYWRVILVLPVKVIVKGSHILLCLLG